MNSVCPNCRNKGTFIHEFRIQYCCIIYPTGLRDKWKTALRQGVSCSINCVLPAGKSVIVYIECKNFRSHVSASSLTASNTNPVKLTRLPLEIMHCRHTWHDYLWPSVSLTWLLQLWSHRHWFRKFTVHWNLLTPITNAAFVWKSIQCCIVLNGKILFGLQILLDYRMMTSCTCKTILLLYCHAILTQ